MDLAERMKKLEEEQERKLNEQGLYSKSALERVREGDHSPQVIAELAAHYLAFVLAKNARRDQLNRQSVDQIWQRFDELGLRHQHRVSWYAGKAVKSSMITPIVDTEFPEQPYKDALELVGVNPQSIWHYSHKYISKAR